ncbi:MAG: hypothetical protein NVSMB26_28900 [Beijerinckiaceae bacterium]
MLALALGLSFSATAAEQREKVKTGKERLGDKSSDEQRVDNCKVAPERWGAKVRSASCGEASKAAATH